MGTLNQCISHAAFTYYIFVTSSYTWSEGKDSYTNLHISYRQQKEESQLRANQIPGKQCDFEGHSKGYYKQAETLYLEFCTKDACSLGIICVCIIYMHLRSQTSIENGLERFAKPQQLSLQQESVYTVYGTSCDSVQAKAAVLQIITAMPAFSITAQL